MKITINADEILNDPRGVPLQQQDGAGLTLSDFLINVLLCEDVGDDGVAKAKFFKICQRLSSGGEIELDMDEVTTMTPKITKYAAPWTFGLVMTILNPEWMQKQ